MFDPNLNPILPDENNIYKLYKPLQIDSGKYVHNDDYYLLSTEYSRGRSNIYENCSMGYLKKEGEVAYSFFLPQ